MELFSYQKPTEADFRCDGIKYYEIHYNKINQERSFSTKASRGDVSKNLTDLDFDAEYEVKVVILNNEDIPSKDNPWQLFNTVSRGEELVLSTWQY